MHILLIILGVLLLLFGGGCTLIILGLMIDDRSNVLSNLLSVMPVWFPLGLLPLVVGWGLVHWGMRSRRAKRDTDRGK